MFYRTFTLALRVQDNILTTATSIKYIDFGLAIEIAPGSQIEDGKRAGSIGYMSPEMEAKLPYSCNSDVWSLGVVVFQVGDTCCHSMHVRLRSSHVPRW